MERAGPLVVRCRSLKRTLKARRVTAAAGAVAAVLLGAFAAWSYQACAVYEPSLLAVADTGATNGNDGAIDSGFVCDHATWPPRPDLSDAGVAGGDFTVVAAFNMIDIGLSADVDAAVPPFGYDLDGVCTCPGLPSCAAQAGAQGKAQQNCDGPGGRDNTSIQLFRTLGAAASTGASQIDQGLMAGQYGLLVVINGYNGQQNDSNVTVDFYVSNGLERDADGGIPTPQLNGNDLWTIDPNSVSGAGATPLYSDDTAYVTQGTLVSRGMPRAIPIAFGDRSFLGGATMLLSGAVIVGQIQSYSVSGDGGTVFAYALTGGTIAGRWATTDLLSTLATIPDSAHDGGFVCGNDSFTYNVIKTVVCQSADISQTPSNDNSSPQLAPCDAISVGLQFAAVPAKLGQVFGVAPAPAGCGTGDVPFRDKCN